MAYTINANAKNVWIRDNEDTRDLSIQTDASSVYLDNGRTLEQELGEGSMVSNVATVDTSMSKVIGGTLDGAYESLVFKGKSLVNLMTSCKDETLIQYHNPPADSNVANVSMIKPNTVYTIIYSVKYREEGNTGHLIVRTQQDGGDINVSSGFTFGTTYKRFAYKFTTPSTIDYFVLRSNGHYFHVKEVMLLEGDYTNVDLPYFEGLCDSKMPILMTTGKNLFDYQDFKNTVLSGGATTKYPINLKPNTTYTFSDKTGLWNGGNGYFVDLSLKDENDVLIAKIIDSNSANRKRFTFTTSNSSEYYLFIYQNNMDKMDKASNDFQIEEGSVATPYEPYKTNILRTSEEIVLRKVGGVCDTYNLLTGEYVRRIGEVILSGSSSEQWNLSGLNSDGTKAGFFILNSDITPQPKSYSLTVNNKLPLLPESTWGSKSHEGCYIGSNALAIIVNTSKLSTPDVGGIRTYLQSNPLTIQYELAQPITTIVEPSTMTPFAYQNGHVILESGYEGQSLLPTLEYSTVVNRTGQVESVAKVIQKQEKQLTMLEQMLIQNIIGLDYNNTVLALNLEINEVM